MKDISEKQDIKTLVDRFYDQALVDQRIGFFFTKVSKLDLKTHLPVLYDFWETILLGKISYKGNPMLKHIELNRKSPIKPEHFEAWLGLWEKTVRENFEGQKAQEAIEKAKQIAGLMKLKVEQKRSYEL